ncbi:SDR family oxidoreductase [Spirosoma validum]|uniref:NAD(P)H-binding protein n=1 Tax=Spirosoma validum TaxID=2771355 RepID=A0A927B2X3_9BACT|nr:NAD(P)H-binding protein [Spirosoma validum]MBD2754351.1 NAD(P)H-binding protein [Spirosoma validum]
MNKILIIGGSGVLGSAVVHTLQTERIDFLTGSRNQLKKDSYSTVNQSTEIPWTRVDLVTGEGLPKALIGVDTVLHLASAPGKIGHEFFETVITRNLLSALKQSTVKHLIYSSIVGVDKIQYSYYRAKREAELLIQESQLPYTILRATQFHDLVDAALGKLMSLPIGFIPKKLLDQPIDVGSVAQKLYQLTQTGPQQTIINLGGPQVLDAGTLVKQWMRYRKISKPIIPIPILGSLMKSFARGEHTCPEKAFDSKTWETYLADRYGSR